MGYTVAMKTKTRCRLETRQHPEKIMEVLLCIILPELTKLLHIPKSPRA